MPILKYKKVTQKNVKELKKHSTKVKQVGGDKEFEHLRDEMLLKDKEKNRRLHYEFLKDDIYYDEPYFL